MNGELGRAAVRGLPLYVPDTVAHCLVDASDNTNMWGAPPASVRAVAAATSSHLSRYPSVYSEPLREGILEYVGLGGIPDIGVVTGCGSDDVLDSTMRAFGSAGDSIAYSTPTFSMIPLLARLNGLVLAPVPLTNTFDVDVQQLVDQKARITYLCAPNNPTATAVSRAAVEYVVSRAVGIVLIDEAYAEFAPETFERLVAQAEHVVVARTFSKAFGLAGLRVGFGVGSRAVVEVIERARGPYKVNGLAELAVLAALETGPDGLDWVRECAALAIINRQRLTAALEALGLIVLPSVATFVMVPTSNAVPVAAALRERGILVRAFTGLPREIEAFAKSGGAALRIGVGPWELMETLLAALGEVL